MRKCLYCHEALAGRVDKKFCSPHCKSGYHYEKNRNNKNNIYLTINRQLKKNRRLLKKYNKAGKAYIRKSTLLAEGFNPNYFTHFWKNRNGDVYLFVFEYGFLAKSDHGKNKYILVQWQSYMKK